VIFKRFKARREVMLAARGVAASYEPSLAVHQFDPDDLAHLRAAVERFDAADPLPYRLRWERHTSRRKLACRSGGGATQWPWWELALPRWGSLILGRKMPRSTRQEAH
jgi:hypothetical protein